jgi:hypothetical protein
MNCNPISSARPYLAPYPAYVQPASPNPRRGIETVSVHMHGMSCLGHSNGFFLKGTRASLKPCPIEPITALYNDLRTETNGSHPSKNDAESARNPWIFQQFQGDGFEIRCIETPYFKS